MIDFGKMYRLLDTNRLLSINSLQYSQEGFECFEPVRALFFFGLEIDRSTFRSVRGGGGGGGQVTFFRSPISIIFFVFFNYL